MQNKNNQATEANPRFIFSPKSGEIKTPNGTKYEIELPEAVQFLLDKSQNKHFNHLFNNIGDAADVLLRSEVPEDVCIKDFQSIIQSLGIIEQFLGYLIREKNE